jgi:hypothetical protein
MQRDTCLGTAAAGPTESGSSTRRWPSPAAGANPLLRLSDQYPQQRGFVCLRQGQCEHPVLELRTDFLLIDPVGQREGPRVSAVEGSVATTRRRRGGSHYFLLAKVRVVDTKFAIVVAQAH